MLRFDADDESDAEVTAWPERTLPSGVPHNPDYRRWYRRFSVPAIVDPERVKFTGECLPSTAVALGPTDLMFIMP